MSEQALAEVQGIIEKVCKKDVSSITEETKIDDLPIDSLDLFTVIGELEDATKRSMEDDEMQALNNVGDLIHHFYA
jgi:acyl carrier protein